MSVFLALLMCLQLTAFQSVAYAQDTIYADRITDELKARLDTAENDELIPVYIWIDDIDYEEVETLTIAEVGYSASDLADRANEILSSVSNTPAGINESNGANGAGSALFEDSDAWTSFLEDTQEMRAELAESVDLYIMTKRELTRETYATQNEEFISSNIEDAELLYTSQYAPMIICELTKSDILDLSANEKVSEISLYVNYEAEDFGNLDISLPAIAADITKSQGIMGAYVKIGQIETGRPMTGVSCLSGKSITRRGTGATDHASLVAAILIGSNGVAPGATLYSTSAYYNSSTGTDNSSYNVTIEYENIEWLISQGVTIINRSFGSSTGGSYNDFSKWVDHIVNQHNVTFVQAAGNNSSQYVSLQSYNAIVVGGINDMGTSSTTDDTYYSHTSYLSMSGGCNKPDVVAPAVGFSIPEAFSGNAVDGTSFAAPHVTGVVAQMMCTVPSLASRPDSIKAALMASCDRKTVSGASLTSLTSKEGAGVINAVNAVNSLSTMALQSTNYTTTASEISYNFYPQTKGYKTIVISWLMRATGSGTNHATITTPSLTNFDLYVYDYNGNLVASSTSTVNNVEFIRFNASTTSMYTVKIVRRSNTTSERISLGIYR